MNYSTICRQGFLDFFVEKKTKIFFVEKKQDPKDFCENFSTNRLEKTSEGNHWCILMCDFNVDSLKSNSKNIAFLSALFVLPTQWPTHVICSSAKLIDNNFMNSQQYDTV